MLTDGQIKYLNSLSDDGKMVIKPWNPRGLIVAESILEKIKSIEPDLETILLGSLPLHIAGQEDIDISVFCLKSEQEKHLPNFKKLFGEPKHMGRVSIGWEFQQEGFSVSVWLTDPTAETTKAQIRIFNLLQENPELLKEYEQIKLEAKDLSYKEYQKIKYEFFNRALGLDA